MNKSQLLLKYENTVSQYKAGICSLQKHQIYEMLWALEKGFILWDDLPPNIDELYDLPNLMDYGIDLINENFTKCSQVKLYGPNSMITWSHYSNFYTYARTLLKINELTLNTTTDALISKHVVCSIF